MQGWNTIWSTLEDTRQWVTLSDDRMPTLLDMYKVPHFNVKGQANRAFTDRGVPTTFLLTSFYWDNFTSFGMGPKRGPDSVLAITMPMGVQKLPGIAVEDIAKCAYGIFKRGRECIGKTVGIAGGHLSGDEMAAALTDALGKEATTPWRPRCTAASAFQVQMTWATCSSSSETSFCLLPTGDFIRVRKGCLRMRRTAEHSRVND
jgi:hypothetical protein